MIGLAEKRKQRQKTEMGQDDRTEIGQGKTAAKQNTTRQDMHKDIQKD